MLDRQKNPTRDVGTQYIRWFDEYAGSFFKVSARDERPYTAGNAAGSFGVNTSIKIKDF